jgi:hypothetical protein
MLNSKDLDLLYTSYGFTKFQCNVPKVNVYGLQTGHFQNADIVVLTSDADAETTKRQFEEIGYACTIRRYCDLDEADESLFRGFLQQNQVGRDCIMNMIGFAEVSRVALGHNILT